MPPEYYQDPSVMLHEAIEKNNEESVIRAIEKGANLETLPRGIESNTYRTPLQQAIYLHSQDRDTKGTVKALLNKGAKAISISQANKLVLPEVLPELQKDALCFAIDREKDELLPIIIKYITTENLKKHIYFEHVIRKIDVKTLLELHPNIIRYQEEIIVAIKKCSSQPEQQTSIIEEMIAKGVKFDIELLIMAVDSKITPSAIQLMVNTVNFKEIKNKRTLLDLLQHTFKILESCPNCSNQKSQDDATEVAKIIVRACLYNPQESKSEPESEFKSKLMPKLTQEFELTIKELSLILSQDKNKNKILEIFQIVLHKIDNDQFEVAKQYLLKSSQLTPELQLEIDRESDLRLLRNSFFELVKCDKVMRRPELRRENPKPVLAPELYNHIGHFLFDREQS